MAELQVSSQHTPNPNSMKFNLDRKILDKGSVTYNSAAEAAASPWAKAIFALPGVASIFAMSNFVSVSKQPGADWGLIVPGVQEALRKNL